MISCQIHCKVAFFNYKASKTEGKIRKGHALPSLRYQHNSIDFELGRFAERMDSLFWALKKKQWVCLRTEVYFQITICGRENDDTC
jgi:hypothetical protein